MTPPSHPPWRVHSATCYRGFPPNYPDRPEAPEEEPIFEDDDATIEVEILSTGGDPDLEKPRRKMIAAHPERKPITTIRHGPKSKPDDPPPDTRRPRRVAVTVSRPV